jgi:hypothetical protein
MARFPALFPRRNPLVLVIAYIANEEFGG